MSMQYELQPLRIISGWTVAFNSFYECNPEDCEEFWSYFNEDLLQLKHREHDLLIDLGWYPDGDRDGAYILNIVQYGNWRKPLEVVRSRDKKLIIEKIELWTNYNFFSKYIAEDGEKFTDFDRPEAEI